MTETDSKAQELKTGSTSKKDKNKKSIFSSNPDEEPADYKPISSRSRRLLILSLFILLVFGNLFLCATKSDINEFRRYSQYQWFIPFIALRWIAGLIIIIATFGILYLTLKKSNEIDNGEQPCMIYIFGILLIIGSFIQIVSAIIGTTANMKSFQFTDPSFTCNDYRKQPMRIFSKDTNEQSIIDREMKTVGPNVCSIPLTYEMILFLFPLMVGIDCLLSGALKLKSIFYSLILLIISLTFLSWLSTLIGYCNAWDRSFENIFTLLPGNPTLDSKCSENGWFPSAQDSRFNSPRTQFNTRRRNSWNSDPVWALTSRGKVEWLMTGFTFLVVGSIISIVVSIVGSEITSCFAKIPMGCLNCRCNGDEKVPLIRFFLYFFLLTGSFLVLVVGESVGNAGYIGYYYNPRSISGTGVADWNDIFPRNAQTSGLSCAMSAYFYWMLYFILPFFICIDTMHF